LAAKSQIPKPKPQQTPNQKRTKSRKPINPLCFGSLKLGISLGFGFWDLGFRRASLFRRYNAKAAKRAHGLLHRKADHVRVRTLDPINDFRTVSLGSVGAGFIERIDFRQVIADRAVVEVPEMNARHFVETARSPARAMGDSDRRPNLMGATAEPPQSLGGVLQVASTTASGSISETRAALRAAFQIVNSRIVSQPCATSSTGGEITSNS